MTRTKQNFVIAVASSSTTTAAPLACAQAVAMRGAPSAARRLVAAPRNQQPFRFDPHEFDQDFSHLDDVV